MGNQYSHRGPAITSDKKKPKTGHPSAHERMLQETREMSRRLRERMEDLNKQFPSPELEDAIRRMKEVEAGLPKTDT